MIPVWSSQRPGWVFPGALLDMDFANGRYWAAGKPVSASSLTVVRAGPDVYTLNIAGDPVGPFSTNALRISNRGISAWTAHTQIFRGNDAPVTQTRTVSIGSTYAISCYGTGSITLVGALTGIVTKGNPVIGIAATTSLILTLSGTVTLPNVESNSIFVEPPIIAPVGASATSAADAISLDLAQFGWWTGVSQYSVLSLYEATAAATTQGTFWQIDDGTNNNRLTSNYIDLTGSGQMGTTVVAAGGSATGYDPALPYIVANNRRQVYGMSFDNVNGNIAVAMADAVVGASPSRTFSGASQPTGMNTLRLGARIAAATPLNGYIYRQIILGGYTTGISSLTAALLAAA